MFTAVELPLLVHFVIVLLPSVAANLFTALISSTRVTILLARTKIQAIILRSRTALSPRKMSVFKGMSMSQGSSE